MCLGECVLSIPFSSQDNKTKQTRPISNSTTIYTHIHEEAHSISTLTPLGDIENNNNNDDDDNDKQQQQQRYLFMYGTLVGAVALLRYRIDI